MIFKALVLGPFAVNCYIVGSEFTSDGMIIDPGDNADRILDSAAQLRLKINTIVLTHAHTDHIGALEAVKEATGAPVAVHESDAPLLNKGATRLFGVSFPAPPKPDKLLQNRNVIKVGSLSFTVLHTPGHTSGSICLYGEGVLFSGDTLFQSSIGRTDLPGGSYRDIMNSIKSKLLTLPDATVVYPGHGPDTTIGDEKENNPFLYLEEKG